MTEVKFPKPSAWFAFRLETDLIDPPELQLELTPAGKKERLSTTLGMSKYFKAGATEPIPEEMMPALEQLAPLAMRHVVGWDLTIGGAPIPCTDEEKAKWLEPLLWEDAEVVGGDPMVEAETPAEQKARWLWARIIEVISSKGNFLKN